MNENRYCFPRTPDCGSWYRETSVRSMRSWIEFSMVNCIDVEEMVQSILSATTAVWVNVEDVSVQLWMVILFLNKKVETFQFSFRLQNTSPIDNNYNFVALLVLCNNGHSINKDEYSTIKFHSFRTSQSIIILLSFFLLCVWKTFYMMHKPQRPRKNNELDLNRPDIQ